MATTTRQLTQTMTAEEYHAYPAISNSRLNDFLRDPRLYHYKWLSGQYKRESKPYFDIGSCVHELVLMDESSWQVIPQDILGKGGARSTKAFREFARAHGGDILLTEAEDQTVHEIAAKVMDDKTAASLLTGEHYQPELPMEAKWLGQNCKCRYDAIHIEDDGCVKIVDVKTTSSPTTAEAFAKSVANFGYHRQQALYTEIAKRNGYNVVDFVFIVVSTSAPYTVDCYRLSSEFDEYGRAEVYDALVELREREETGYWGSRSCGKIGEVKMPRWMARRG